MVTSGIPSARKKLERARFHLDALHTEVRAFRDHSPYEFDSRSLGNEPGSPDFRVTVKVTDAPPIPDTWPLITGDILTNVRAALDHAVFPHVQATDPDEKPWRIQYPIEDTDTRFEDKSGGWFAGDVRDAGERSQLYRDEDGASRNPLRMLRVLVNMDKHRDLVLANYSIDDFVVPPHDLYKVVSATVNITEMVPGAVVARAHLRLVQAVQGEHWMQFPFYVDYGENIEVPGCDRPVGLLDTMVRIFATVDQCLDALEQAGC